MSSEVLAMFPLPTPLVPGTVMPLQVFEPRYRQMMARVLADDPRQFGVAMITRGHQVGGGDLRAMVATRAEVLQEEHLDDGRQLLLVLGRQRLRVDRWLRDDPYPLAEVEAWPDERWPDERWPDERWPDQGWPDESGDEVGRIDIQSRLDDIVALVADRVPVADRDQLYESSNLPVDLGRAIWQATVVADLGPLDRQRLLECPGQHERLRLLVDLLEERRDVLAFTLDDRG